MSVLKWVIYNGCNMFFDLNSFTGTQTVGKYKILSLLLCVEMSSFNFFYSLPCLCLLSLILLGGFFFLGWIYNTLRVKTQQASDD